MFYLPSWALNFNSTAIDLSSNSSLSEAKTESRNDSSTVNQPTPSAFVNYKDAVSETTTTSSSLSSTEAPATTGLGALQSQIQLLPTSLFENSSAETEKRMWQNLLTSDVLTSMAASAANVGEVLRHPSSLVVGASWNQALINSNYETSRLVDLKLETAMQRSKAVGTRESTGTLKAWLCQHLKNPYPSKGEKIMLAIVTRMTLTQVSTWFANARRRLKKERSIRWRVDGDDDDDDDDDNFADCEDYNGDDYENECDDNDRCRAEKEDGSGDGTPESKRKYPSDRLTCPGFKKQCLQPNVNRKTRADHSAMKKTSGGTTSSPSFIRDRSPDDRRSPSPPITPVDWISRQSTSSGDHDDAIVCRHSSDSDEADDPLRSPSPPSLPSSVDARSKADAGRGGSCAIDLSRSSATGKSASGPASPTPSSASKPRIWSIVELATA